MFAWRPRQAAAAQAGRCGGGGSRTKEERACLPTGGAGTRSLDGGALPAPRHLQSWARHGALGLRKERRKERGERAILHREAHLEEKTSMM